jgi:threonine synthase
MHFYCEKCKKEYPMNTMSYKCKCGGFFRIYRNPDDKYSDDISIGATKTDLLPIKIDNMTFLLKMENLQPTGSFKDRGACTMINELYQLGIERIAEDSSGNAGAAIAAYAAAAGIECTIFVPQGISKKRIEQIKGYGAKIRRVKGGRMDTCRKVKENLAGAYYASHVYNPLFNEGMKAMAYEIYHQLENRVPEYIFMPVGNGTLLLGLYYGFMEIGRLPHLVAVQSTKCAPLYEAFYGLPESEKGFTIAEAIRIGKPFRLQEMLEALRNSQGDVIAVEDEEILKAKEYLGHHGIYIEPTSAAALAGALHVFRHGKPDNYRVVIPLTGTGFKS